MPHRTRLVRLTSAFCVVALVVAWAYAADTKWPPLKPVADRLGGPVTLPTDGDPHDPAIPEEYRLSARDEEYLPYLKFWDMLPELRSVRLTPEVFARPDTVLLVGDDGFTLTVGQLANWLWASGRPVNFATLLEHRPDLIERGLREASFIKAVRDEAVELGYADGAGVRTDMRFARERILRPAMYEYAMRERGQPVTDQMVELTYEREKAARYRRPLGFEAQQIFLMAYTRHEVVSTDTDLREIATRLAGSERAVTDIRADDARKKRRWVPDIQRDRLAFSQITPGERLLVPMDEGGMEALAGKAVDIERRLEAGEDFVALAREFSDDPHPGETLDSSKLQADVRLLSEIRKAIDATEVGAATPFIRTPHGFLKLKILSKRPESFAPLEDVGPEIRRELERAELQRVATAFLDDLRSSPTVEVHDEVILESAGEMTLPLDRVIARVEGKDLTFGDIFSNDGLRGMYADADADNRLRLIRQSRVFNDPIYERFSRDHGIYDNPEVAGRLDYYHEWAMAKRIAADYILGHYYESTPLLYRFYLDNPNIFVQRESFRLRVIEKLPPQNTEAREALLAQLDELKATLLTEEDFARAAETMSDDPAHRAQGGLTEDLYAPDMTYEFREALTGLDAGTLVGPFLSGNRFYLVWIVERTESAIMPFEKTFRRAATNYETRVHENLRKDYILRMLREKNVRVNPDLLASYPAPSPASAASAAADAEAAPGAGPAPSATPAAEPAADPTAGQTASPGG